MNHPHSKGGKSLRRLLCLLSPAALLFCASSTSAEVIYRETFGGSAKEPIAGRPPAIRSGTLGGGASAVWVGPDHSKNNRIFADGSLQMPATFAVGASAFLPFRPTVGLVYKLNVSGLHIPVGDWVGAGFSTATPPGGDVRFRDNDVVFWGLLRNENATLPDQTFTGPEIVGPVDSKVRSSSSLTVLLDTSSSNTWSVQWFLDGSLVRSGKFPAQPITHAGFGFNAAATGPAGTSHIGLFTLEGSAPEVDTDADGLADPWEIARFRASPQDTPEQIIARHDGSADPDGDTFTNYEEYVAGSDPTKTASTPLDTDADGIEDAWEFRHFGSTNAPEARVDSDPDLDGFTNLQEFQHRTSPRDAQSKPSAGVAAAAKPAVAAMDVARSGSDVFLAWTLPPGPVSKVEIHRNDREGAAGRTLIATVNAPASVYLDQVPDSAATYWYWLGVQRPDGKTDLHGPFATKSVQVWQP